MTEILSVTYCDIPISYDEKRNLWVFELRGRARTAESLEKAKNAIDAPVKDKSKAAFERFRAWKKESWEGWKECEVTSIGEPSRYGGYHQVWTTMGKKRSLEQSDRIYPRNENNDKLVQEWTALDKQRKEIEDRQRKAQGNLKCYVVPKEEATT